MCRREPNQDQIRTGLSLIYNGIFPSVQSEFYEFCEFFDHPLNRLTEIPKVIYDDEKKRAYLQLIADMAAIFPDQTTSKLSHLAFPESQGKVPRLRKITPEVALRIKAFLLTMFEAFLHPGIYCMDYLRNQLGKISSGRELETFVTEVRKELIDFPTNPAKALSTAVVDSLDNTLSQGQIKGSWSFSEFPLYWVHIHQLLKIFVLNFEKHERAEFDVSQLSNVRISFEPDGARLAMEVSAPGSISNWSAVTKSLEDALSDNCEIEKLSGLRKIACEYYDAEVQIVSGNTMVRATRSQVNETGSDAMRINTSGVTYRFIFPSL